MPLLHQGFGQEELRRQQPVRSEFIPTPKLL
jgi:hypothetical protein